MKSNILCILSCYLLILSAAAMSRAATGSGTGAGVTFQPGVSSQVATPVFSPGGGTYTGAQQVAISDATDGAFIGYTTDGSTPSESGGVVAHGTLLLNVGSVSISANTTLKAIAFEGGLADSPVVTAVYNIQSATPAFSLAAGTYIGTQSVSISSAANGVSFAYTTDGTTPREVGGTVTNGTLYSGAVSISASTTLRAIAFGNGFADSAVGTAVYNIQVTTPTFSPGGGEYNGAQTVTISDATSGASIAYTTDGSTPAESNGSVTNGTLYSSAVSIGSSTLLNAIAFTSGLIDSAVGTATYTIDLPLVATPTFSPGGGLYAAAQPVTISDVTGGALIDYTTDGSTPTENDGTVTNGTLYSGAISISTDTFLSAIAFEGGFADSIVGTAFYDIQAATPTFSLGAGTYTSVQSVTISSTTVGVSFAYTTDGSTPTESGGTVTNGTLYFGAIPIDATTTLNVIAFEDGIYEDSPVGTATYTLNLPLAATPTFSPVAGTYTSVQSVTINSTTGGASIAYTTDGSIPTESGGTITNGNLYSGAISIGATTTLNAIAFESGFADSNVATANYTLNLPLAATPTFSPGAGSYTSTQSVTISSTTGGASIAYTTDGSTPTESGGTVTNGQSYSGPVFIGATTTLNAIAFESGFADSIVGTGGFTITLPIAAPTFSPAAGTYAGAQTVTISSTTSGVTINYTTDGSTPSETNGTVYSGPVSIGRSAILKALAYETGFSDSPVTKGIYTITSSPAVIVNVLYDFTGSNDGANPNPGLIQGTDGNFYGITNQAGTNSDGTVFKVTPAGVLTTLASFTGTNGANPDAALIQGTDGNFYGTTEFGGSSNDGTVFKITSTGALTTLVSFTGLNGFNPDAALIQGTDGNFYGTTVNGGSTFVSTANTIDEGDGTVFKLASSDGGWNLTTLASFTGLNGFYPDSAVVQGTDGDFYGTTLFGGSTFVSTANTTDEGDGTVFKISPTGTFTTLLSFTGVNGYNPDAALIQGTDGNFYGTTNTGGSTFVSASSPGGGTVFKITSTGALTSLVSFTGSNGIYIDASLIQGTDGNFYGMTSGGGGTFVSASSPGDGTFFKITPTGALTNLLSLDGLNGDYSDARLVLGTDGNFYGTTSIGGLYNDGAIIQLIVPAANSAPVFSPAAGTYTGAQTVTITTTISGASIIYTTDGSTPTESGDSITHGTLYSGPVSISSTATLKAIAFKSGDTDSPVTSGIYTINPAPTPAATPPPSGGGGAMDGWFLGCLAFAGILRWKRRKAP